MAGNRISLSMKDVNQLTGEDLNPLLNEKTEDLSDTERETARNPDRPAFIELSVSVYVGNLFS